MRKVLKRLRYRKKLNHVEYNLMVSKLKLQSKDSKYYYFMDITTNKGHKVLKNENGEQLDIIMDI